jgi:hypothetical protein
MKGKGQQKTTGEVRPWQNLICYQFEGALTEGLWGYP